MPKAVTSFIRGNTKDTVIVLLGWALSKDDHLEKYSKLYHQRGYDSLRYTAPLPEKFKPKLRDSRNVADVANELRSILEMNDIAFHLFSMNGVITLCSLVLQYPELQVLQRTRGIIFDSGPSIVGKESIPIYMQLLDQARDEKNNTPEGLKKIQYNFNKGVLSARMKHQYAREFLMHQLGVDISQYNAYHFLLNHPDLPKVLYFVNSKIDNICQARESQEFADHQRKRGKSVAELHFEDSGHVQHYRKHPEEYIMLVDSFLGNIKAKSRL